MCSRIQNFLISERGRLHVRYYLPITGALGFKAARVVWSRELQVLAPVGSDFVVNCSQGNEPPFASCNRGPFGADLVARTMRHELLGEDRSARTV